MKFVLKFFALFCNYLLVDTAYKRVCYYTNWAQYRGGGMSYFPGNYETGLCTHIIYAFGKVVLNSNTGIYEIQPYEWNDVSVGYKGMEKLKNDDPNLKVLLAIGGWNHGTTTFTKMVTNASTRAAFIHSSVIFLIGHGFDGLDLDWEYPAQRGSPPIDKERFTLLCMEMKAEYSKHGLLLTAAVAAGQGSVDRSYEMLEVSESLDFINLMAYDLHGGWESKTGHHTDTNPFLDSSKFSVINSVEHWLSSGMNSEKLVLGLGTYGRSFTLLDECGSGLNAPARGSGQTGPITGEAGFLAYYEICQMKWTSRTCTKSSGAFAPYGSVGTQFVGYDDEESIVYKVQNIVKPYQLGGIMFWALDLDDFKNVCGQGTYPLIKIASKALHSEFVQFSLCTYIQGCNDPSVGGGLSTTPTTTTAVVPPSGRSLCSTLPELGNRAECYWNSGGFYGSNVQKWCVNSCLTDETCNPDMCCCDPVATMPPKLSSSGTKATASPKSKTTSLPPSICEMPSIGKRGKCTINPNNLLSTFSVIKSYCESKCSKDESCCSELCCCTNEDDEKSTTTATTTNQPFTTLTTITSTIPTTQTTTQITITSTTEEKGDCSIPPYNKRTNCRANKNGPWGSIDRFDEWCSVNCPYLRSCSNEMCCCDTL